MSSKRSKQKMGKSSRVKRSSVEVPVSAALPSGVVSVIRDMKNQIDTLKASVTGKPASAADTKVDEKYVQVPPKSVVAVDSALDALNLALDCSKEGKTISGDISRYRLESAIRSLSNVKQEIVKPLISSADEKMMVVKNILTRKGIQHEFSSRPSRQKPLKVWCIDRYSLASAANTALTTVQSMTPCSSADCVALAAVYDICRTTAAEVSITYCLLNATPIPAGAAAFADFGVAYDPANNGVYANVAQTLEAQHHIGVQSISNYGGTAGPNHIGLPKMHIKIPRLVDPGILTDLLDSNWVSSTDTSVVVGYLKPYVEACGTAITFNIRYYVKYAMEFAFRT